MGRARVSCCLTFIAVYFVVAVPRGLSAQISKADPAKLLSSTTATVGYDVVTIRPNHQGPGSVRVSITLDDYAATNVSLIDLLRDAYHLRPGQLDGQPKWADSDRFDVHAKILDTPAETIKNLTPEDRERMLRGLLADRFHLQVHNEIRTLSVMELTPAKGGAKLQAVPEESRNDPFHGVSPSGFSVRNGHLIGHYLPIDRLIDFLGFQVDRVVLDKTGLPGDYNMELNWTPDDQPASDDSAAPPLLTALEQQLGLKLIPTKAPVQIYVIDHVEPPSDN